MRNSTLKWLEFSRTLHLTDAIPSLLEKFSTEHPELTSEQIDGLNFLLPEILKNGGTLNEVLAISAVPGYLENMTVALAIQNNSFAKYGRDFGSLSDTEREVIIKQLMTYGKVVSLTSINPMTGEENKTSATGVQVSAQQKLGRAFSEAVTSGLVSIDKVIQWLGKDNATAAGIGLSVALAGPLKTATSLIYENSPVGEWVNEQKAGFVDKVNPFVGYYLFGASTSDEQDAVKAASNAVSWGSVELLRSVFGSLATGVKGVVNQADGYTIKYEDAKLGNASSLISRQFNGVEIHPNLPAPAAGWDYSPKLLDSSNPRTACAHINGFIAEVRLANAIAAVKDQIVVKYGDAIGRHGADIVSVDVKTGMVSIWDSKFRSRNVGVKDSGTFTEYSARLRNSLAEAEAAIPLCQGSCRLIEV